MLEFLSWVSTTPERPPSWKLFQRRIFLRSCQRKDLISSRWLKMGSNLMSGISVVKKPSDHIGKTTMRIQMALFSSLTPVMRKDLTSVLKNLIPWWPRKHLLKFLFLFTPISRTFNLPLRLKRSSMLLNCQRSRKEHGIFKPAPPSPKKVSRKAWSGSSSPFQTKRRDPDAEKMSNL